MNSLITLQAYPLEQDYCNIPFVDVATQLLDQQSRECAHFWQTDIMQAVPAVTLCQHTYLAPTGKVIGVTEH